MTTEAFSCPSVVLQDVQDRGTEKLPKSQQKASSRSAAPKPQVCCALPSKDIPCLSTIDDRAITKAFHLAIAHVQHVRSPIAGSALCCHPVLTLLLSYEEQVHDLAWKTAVAPSHQIK